MARSEAARTPELGPQNPPSPAVYPVPSLVEVFTKLVDRGTIFKGLRSILNEQAKQLKLELTGQFIIILELSFVFIHMGTLLSV